MAKTKKLTLDEVRKLDKKNFGGTKKIKIGEYVITVQTKFRQTEVRDLVKDIIVLLGEMVEQNIDLNNVLASILSTLIIKKFTDVEGIPDDLSGVVEATNYLIDNDLLAPIFASFDPDELKKLNLHLSKVISGVDGISTSVELKDALTNVEQVESEE